MNFEQSEVLRKREKRAGVDSLEAFRIQSAERIANARLVEASSHARVLDTIVVVCALVLIAAVVS